MNADICLKITASSNFAKTSSVLEILPLSCFGNGVRGATLFLLELLKYTLAAVGTISALGTQIGDPNMEASTCEGFLPFGAYDLCSTRAK